MTIHKSLKVKSRLARARNVLTRQERIQKLQHDDKWKEGENSIFGLPKVASIVLKKRGGKQKKKEEEKEEKEEAKKK